MLGSRLLEIVVAPSPSSRESSVCSDEESQSAASPGAAEAPAQQPPQPLRHALSFRGRLQTSGGVGGGGGATLGGGADVNDSGWQRLGLGPDGTGLQRARSMREGRRAAACPTETAAVAASASASPQPQPTPTRQSPRPQPPTSSGGSRSPRAFEAEVSVEHFQFDLYLPAPAAASAAAAAASAEAAPAQPEGEAPCGLVNLRVSYDFDRAALLVGLRHAKDLRLPASPEAAAAAALLSPFARVQLQPRKQQQRVSGVQKRTAYPIWNEQLRFEVADYRACQAAQLEVELRSHSRRGSRRIGIARVPLAGVNVQAGDTVTLPVFPCAMEPDDIGDVLLSLHYLPNAKRLSADIMRVRNLLQCDVTKKLEPLIKVSFHDGRKVIKTKKTGKRNSLTGELRDTFRLDIGESELDQLTIGLRVFSQPRFKESLIGQASIGRLASGTEEADLWRQLLLSAGKGGTESVSAWVPLRPKQQQQDCSSICQQSSP